MPKNTSSLTYAGKDKSVDLSESLNQDTTCYVCGSPIGNGVLCSACSQKLKLKDKGLGKTSA